MSKGTLGQVVKRAISDAAFRRQLQSDPEGALKGFDLTSDERAALRSGDASKLSAFGINQRMSKAFISEDAGAASRQAFGSELSNSSGAQAAFTDQDGALGGARTGLVDDAGGAVRSSITSEGTGVRTALGDQHDGGRAAIGDNASGGRTALDSSGTASREGTAYITADEAGNDVVAGGSLGPEQHAVVSSDGRDPYLSARDSGTGEFVRDIGTGEPFATTAAAPLGPEQHAVVSSDGLDPYLSARDSGTGEFVRDIGTGEPFARAAAAPLGPEQHAVVSSDGRDPYVTARDSGTGEFVRDIGTGEAIGAGAQSSLDVSGQTRDASVIDSGSAGSQTDAFLTADEMGNDVSASGGSHPSQSADQRLAGETLEGDINASDAATDPWAAENPEHQG